MEFPAGKPTAQRELEAGRDYPRTYRELVKMFPDEEACTAYLEQLRWPRGFSCPACGATATPWRQSRARLVCAACRHQASVTAGTILDKTRTPLTTWFEAAWHVTTAKNGLSAQTMERTLGTSYRVAWAMLQRYRVAMVRADRTRLAGEVEVDEAYAGGVKHGGGRGRGTSKCIVVIAVEVRQPKGFGRVRMRHVPDVSVASLLPFVCEAVAPGTRVLTDGWGGYNGLSKHGYQREKIVVSSSGDATRCTPGRRHERGLATHQGAVTADHLQSYLEEFTFRFNRRTSRSRGHVFRRLLEQAVVTGPITESDVTRGYDW